jgi:LacI family transcriptional regulator
MEQKRVVMKDIAQAAGLHQTTISLALADNPRIAKKTRLKIQALAKEMGYVPDPNLVSLVSYKKNSKHKSIKPSVAIIFDLDDDHLFNEADYLPTIKQTAEHELIKNGYQPETLFLNKDFSSTESLNRLLYNRGIEGVIFAATYHMDTHYELEWNRYAMVKIHDHPFELKIDSIMPNHIDSMRVAMEQLKAHGFKRPVFVAHRLDELHTQNAFSLAFYYSQSIFCTRGSY